MTEQSIHQGLIILGMHRSGTSWLTGSLQQAGVFLAKHHSWNPHNRKGNRENQDVMELHEAVLADNHGRWDQPPQSIQWSPQRLAAAQELINNNAAQRRWGFKDPRTLLMLEGWQSLFDDLQYIGIYRHPLAVAASLHARGAMPQQQALDLWLHYNTLLFRQYQRQAFPLLCFDWSQQQLHSAFESACKQLGLNVLIELVDFYDDSLRRNSPVSDQALPDAVDSLYQQLNQIAQSYIA